MIVDVTGEDGSTEQYPARMITGTGDTMAMLWRFDPASHRAMMSVTHIGSGLCVAWFRNPTDAERFARAFWRHLTTAQQDELKTCRHCLLGERRWAAVKAWIWQWENGDG